jgi:hypothetical protein
VSDGSSESDSKVSTRYVVAAPSAEPEPDEVPETPATPASAPPQIVYVDRPAPPRALSNRPIALLVSVLATVLFAVLAAFTVLIAVRTLTGVAVMSDLANPGFWVPVLLFLVANLVSVLVLNRAGWWAHVLGSALVALVVYFGTGVLVSAIEAYGLGNAVTIGAALASPVTIVCALLAREVSLWSGAILGRRGRSLTARNAERRAEYERALAGARSS